jgi:LysR family glycine cleavage system transcriptional activator
VAIAQRALVSKELEDGSLVCPLLHVVDRGDYTYYVAWSTRRAPSVELQVFRTWLGSDAFRRELGNASDRFRRDHRSQMDRHAG